MKTALPLYALFALVATPALADTPLDLHHTASATAHVRIANAKGSIAVSAWDRNEVTVSGSLGDGGQPLAIEGSDTALAIEVKPQGGTGWSGFGGDSRMGETDLRVRVPKGASLDIDGVSANVAVDGMAGGTIAVKTVSGRARIEARTPSLTVSSVSGRIELAGHADAAKLNSVSGDILSPVLGRTASLRTVSGRIQARGGPWQTLGLSTVSGDVQVAGGPASGGTLSIDSMSGDVEARLPAALSARLQASSFSGDLRSDFGQPQSSEHGPGSHLAVTVGSGNGKVDLQTFSGDLRVRKGG